jgi:hypothetical protein
VLTSKVVYEGVSSVLELLKSSDLDGAKKKLEAIGAEAKTERERGSLLAAQGLYNSIAKSREGSVQSWDLDRLLKAVRSIKDSQMADEFDVGYAETLSSYAKQHSGAERPSPV